MRCQEVGYVLLEECDVLIPGCAVGPPAGMWYNVDLQAPPDKSDKSDKLCKGGGFSGSNDDGCDLVLQPCFSSTDDAKPIILLVNATEIIPFNGLLEITAQTDKATRKSKKRRSDASLLAGLALEINQQANHFQRQNSYNDDSSIELGEKDDGLHLRHLRTENVQIMFWEEEASCKDTKKQWLQLDNETDQDSANEAPNDQHLQTKRVRASLLVTFSLPMQENGTQINNNMSSGENESRVKRKASKSKRKDKIISSGHQLIGSIIRCDWGHLDVRMKMLQQSALSSRAQPEQTSRKSFFPSSLLYL